MLTASQIDYALTCYKHVDTVADFSGDSVASFHHTKRGVFCIVRESVTDEIIENECFHVPYLWLAVMNNREWPVRCVPGQTDVVIDQGDYYIIRRSFTDYLEEKKKIVKIDEGGYDFFDMIFATSFRDANGFPVVNTEWEFEGGLYRVTHIKRKKTRGTVHMEMVGQERTIKRFLMLDVFNEKCTPRRSA